MKTNTGYTWVVNDSSFSIYLIEADEENNNNNQKKKKKYSFPLFVGRSSVRMRPKVKLFLISLVYHFFRIN